MKQKHPTSTPTSTRAIVVAQFAILGTFVLFAAGVIGWIVHLVRLSFDLDDVPDASMAISLIAIPVFLTLTALVTYVVVGLVLDPDARSEGNREEDEC